MGLEDLAKAGSRMFTCSVSDLIEFHGLDKNSLALTPFFYNHTVYVSKSSESQKNVIDAYTGAEKVIREKDLLAIGDARISESFLVIKGAENMHSVTIYGTAIVQK